MSIEQRLNLERDDRCHESNQARYAGRLKLHGCPECGSDFGMFSATREQMAKFRPGAVERFAPWYSETGNTLVLYYPCWVCNFDGKCPVPDSFELLTIADVVAWFNLPWFDCDPMTPDYEALAAEKPVSQIGDSRDSAGL